MLFYLHCSRGLVWLIKNASGVLNLIHGMVCDFCVFVNLSIKQKQIEAPCPLPSGAEFFNVRHGERFCMQKECHAKLLEGKKRRT